MNRVRRDYCNRGRHPAWKWWEARYTAGVFPAYIGSFCMQCGARVDGTARGSPPHGRSEWHPSLLLKRRLARHVAGRGQ